MKKGSHCICLSVILIDSVSTTVKNCYSQALLQEGKYVAKRKKVRWYINDDLEISSDDSNKQ